MHFKRLRRHLGLVGCLWAAAVQFAVAAPIKPTPRNSVPPSFVLGVGSPVAINTADKFLRVRMGTMSKKTALRVKPRSLSLLSTSAVTCGTSTTLPVEITTLAASLKCDPDLIFEYVHNNIEYEPLFGSNKGPLGTLLDMRGSDSDQAQLFIALLQAAGFNSTQYNYQYGYIRLTGAQAVGWLGVKNDAVAIENLIANGGTPISTMVANMDGTLNYIDIAHVWVQVQIGGLFYIFDPSFKQHTVNTGLGASLASVLGYTQSQFLTDAGGSIDPTDNSIRNINRALTRADLTTYAQNLVSYILGHNPAWTVNDIVGGKTIQPLTGSPIRQGSLPYVSPSQPSGYPMAWGTSIPNAYRTCFSISMPGVTPTSCTSPSSSTIALFTDQTYGHRITIFSVASGSNYVPTLLIDGALPPNGTNTGPATSGGSNWAVNIEVTHPYASSSLAAANQTGTLNMAAGGNYLVSNGWGQVGRGMVEKHRALLAQARSSGAAANSEVVLGESLAIIGYTWLAETAASERLRDGVAVATTQTHHNIGVTAQGLIQGQATTVGPYVDTPFDYISIQPQTAYTGSCISPTVQGSFFGTWGTASAMEGAVLEQTQALTAGMQAVSTIRLIDTNAGFAAARTYFADGTTSAGLANYFSVVRPTLVSTYQASDLATIDAAISTNSLSSGSPTGNQVLIPVVGTYNVGFWSGTGYAVTAQACPTGMPYTLSAQHWITGGFNGGQTGVNVPTTAGAGTPVISSNSQTLTTPPSADALLPGGALANAHAAGNPLAGNPVDGVSGGYVYSHSDLTTGGGGFPFALSFSREYSSASYTSDIGLGNGWSHNFTMSASTTTDPYIGLGDRAPIAAAAVGSVLAGAGESSAIAAAQAIAATYVTQDLLSGAQSAQNMTISSIAQRWFTDQLTNNAVMISAPTSSGEFTWLPHADGATAFTYLPPPGAAGTLIGTVPGSTGVPTVFNFTAKDQSKIAYTAIGSAGNGQIASWTLPSGMSLNFTYGYTFNAVSYLTQVSNSLGRSLNLAYSGAHVTSVADDTGRSVAYGYDATTGDMLSASDPMGATTTFVYDRTGTFDTNGHLTQVYYPSRPGVAFVTNWYDAVGRVAQQTDALNNRITFWVAGTRTEIANPAGARQVSYQTPRGLVTMQAAVLSGSYGNVFSDSANSAGNLNVAYRQYDGQDRLVLSTAPEGGTTAYAYSSDLQQNIVSTTATPKPGSGLSALTSTVTYDAVFNTPVSSTDPKGLVATAAYDPATGNLIKSVADVGGSGHFNVTSRFTYDGVGHLRTTTDAKGVVNLMTYDSFGNLTSVTGDYGRTNVTARATYDALGNVLTATDANGNTTAMTYDLDRRLVSVRLPPTGASAPVVTTFTYDLDGELLTTQQSAAGVLLRTVSSSYTPTGNLATATDPKGNVLRYSYDNVDRVSAVTDPVGNTSTVAYDAMSRTVAAYQPAIQSQPLVQTAYTPDGATASLTIARGPTTADTTSYAYDGFDRSYTVTYPDTSYEAYSYDLDSNVLTRRTRKGDIIGFSYDTLNRLITKTPPTGTGPTVTYAYDQGSSLVGVSDTSAAITTPASSASYGVSTTYDALNRPIATSYSGVAAQTTPTATSVTFTHGYDENNRRTSQAATDNSWLGYPASMAVSTTYAANNLNQYTAVASVTPTYDGNGSLTYDGQFTYGYDVENRLASVVNGASSVATYAYDAQARRKSKTVGSAKTIYVTDEANNGVLDYDGTTGAILHWYPAGSQVDVVGGTRATFITDIQGSVIGTLSSGGTLTKIGYQPFGENPNLTADGYHYTGQQLDAETAGSTAEPSGLYYLRSRMYSPTLGRFLQPDTIGYGGGANMYAYTNNDPLNRSDRSGRDYEGSGDATDGAYSGLSGDTGGTDSGGLPPGVDGLTVTPDSGDNSTGGSGGWGGGGGSGGGGSGDTNGGDTNGAIPDPGAPANTPAAAPPAATTPALGTTPVSEVVVTASPSTGVAQATVVLTSNQSILAATPVKVMLSTSVRNIKIMPAGCAAEEPSSKLGEKASKVAEGASAVANTAALTGVLLAEIPPAALFFEGVAVTAKGVNAVATGVAVVAQYTAGDKQGALTSLGNFFLGGAYGKVFAKNLPEKYAPVGDAVGDVTASHITPAACKV